MTKRKPKLTPNKFNPSLVRTEREQTQIDNTFEVVEKEQSESMSKESGFGNYPEHKMYGPEDKESKPLSEVKYVVAKVNVNFREGPSLNATIINTARKGDKFILLDGRLEDWIKVRTLQEPARVGYLKSEFVEEI